jgi:D-3-phosphoglycerate dehydrogenase
MTGLKSCRVLVTPTSYAKNDKRLRTELEEQVGEVVYNTFGRPLNAGELVELIPDIDGYIAGLDEINGEVISKAKKLKVISRYGVGVDAVDLEAAREKGVIVTNTPGANSSSVAELTVGLILSLARSIPQAVQATKSGNWPRLRGLSLEGKVVGLLGFGSIGKHVARRLVGFGCEVLAFDPYPDKEGADELGVSLVDMENLVRMSDFLSLHCPLLPETKGIVNAEFLSKMKRGSYLVNTSRGEMVDELALFEALEGETINGAALDVFCEQPPEPANPLLNHPKVIATPHMGAHTDGATDAMGWEALLDCLAVLRSDEPQNRVV